jgi:hypothetical protein
VGRKSGGKRSGLLGTALPRDQDPSPSVAWTGRLSLPVRLMVNASNLLAWLAWATGAAADTEAMKAHVRLG